MDIEERRLHWAEARAELCEEIEKQITYRRTAAGQAIVVRPSDNPNFEARDLTDEIEREWWAAWCRAEGEFQAMRAERQPAERDAIAAGAGYVDWADACDAMLRAIDDDGVMAIQGALAQAAVTKAAVSKCGPDCNCAVCEYHRAAVTR